MSLLIIYPHMIQNSFMDSFFLISRNMNYLPTMFPSFSSDNEFVKEWPFIKYPNRAIVSACTQDTSSGSRGDGLGLQLLEVLDFVALGGGNLDPHDTRQHQRVVSTAVAPWVKLPQTSQPRSVWLAVLLHLQSAGGHWVVSPSTHHCKRHAHVTSGRRQ